jgi:hypothetical protein
LRKALAAAAAIVSVLATAVPAWAQYPPEEPTCQVNQTVVAPGESVQVSGDNWQENSSVQVRFHQGNLAQVYGPFPTDADGSFSASITIPGNAKDGPAQIAVGGPDQSADRTRCVVQVTVDSGSPPGDSTRCGIDDATPAPGQTVKVNGQKWLPQSTVEIEFSQGASSEHLATAKVNGSGRFGKRVVIPEDAQDGEAQIVVLGQDGDGDPTECRITIVVTSSSTAASGFTLARPATPATIAMLLGTALVVLIGRRRHTRALLRAR